MNVLLETVMYAILSTVNTCELIIPSETQDFVAIHTLLPYLTCYYIYICFVISVLLVKQHAIASSHKKNIITLLISKLYSIKNHTSIS